MKQYFRGNLAALTQEDCKQLQKTADSFELGNDDLLYYVGMQRRPHPDGEGPQMSVVLPSTLQQEVLHHYHTSLVGGHQGISRTFARLTARFYWKNMFRSVQKFIKTCVDCETEKGEPRTRSRSPGSIQASYPFQVLGLDHIPSMPKSKRGNTELLIWVDQHTGFVIVSTNAG